MSSRAPRIVLSASRRAWGATRVPIPPLRCHLAANDRIHRGPTDADGAGDGGDRLAVGVQALDGAYLVGVELLGLALRAAAPALARAHALIASRWSRSFWSRLLTRTYAATAMARPSDRQPSHCLTGRIANGGRDVKGGVNLKPSFGAEFMRPIPVVWSGSWAA